MTPATKGGRTVGWALVWHAGRVQSAGANAWSKQHRARISHCQSMARRDGRVAEGGGLLNLYFPLADHPARWGVPPRKPCKIRGKPMAGRKRKPLKHRSVRKRGSTMVWFIVLFGSAVSASIRGTASAAAPTAGSPQGRQPLWPPLFPAGLGTPRLDGSFVACRPERRGGRGKPDGVCELGGPMLLAPVAKMQGTGGGSFGASRSTTFGASVFRTKGTSTRWS
jgi:hypothetical protein